MCSDTWTSLDNLSVQILIYLLHMVTSSPGGPARWKPSSGVGDRIIEGLEEDAVAGGVIVAGDAVAIANIAVTGTIRERCWESGTNSSGRSWHY